MEATYSQSRNRAKKESPIVMRIAVRPLWGNHVWSDVEEPQGRRLPAGGGTIRLMFDEETPVGVSCNGQEINPSTSSRNYEAICVTGKVTRFNFLIRWRDGESKKIEFVDYTETPIPNELLRDLSDFERQLRAWCAGSITTTASLVSALSQGSLTLLMRTNPMTAINPHWKLKEIGKAVPFLTMVCQRPRLHLVIEESVRPVEVVRRTGPAAIKHLLQHSEHWRAKTFTGLSPLRLLAQVIEDDWNLYENRFVITLIRRLDGYLSDVRTQVEQAYRQASQSIDFMQYDNALFARCPSPVRQLLLPNVDTDLIGDSYLELSGLRDTLRRLGGAVANCKSSRFYSVLRNCPSTPNPIRATNILTKDSRYRALLTLWEQLQSSNEFREIGGDGLLPEDLSLTYSRYCQVLLIAAFHSVGFHPVDADGSLVANTHGESTFRASGIYERGPWSVTVKVDPSEPLGTISVRFSRLAHRKFKLPTGIRIPALQISRRFEIQGDTITVFDKPTNTEKRDLKMLFSDPDKRRLESEWKHFIEDLSRKADSADSHELHLIPLLTRLQPDDPDLIQLTTRLLELGVENNARRGSSTIFLVPAELSLSLPSATTTLLTRRLLNYGDSYQSVDSQKWGSYRTGILPASRQHFNSLARLMRLIQINTIEKDITAGRAFTHCPACISPSVYNDECGTSRCREVDCGAVWGETRCSGSGSCGKSFAWLRFRGFGKAPSQEKTGTNYGKLLEELEDIPHPVSGSTPLPSFCEAFGVERHRYPICPHCGHCTGRDNNASACIRCASEI